MDKETQELPVPTIPFPVNRYSELDAGSDSGLVDNLLLIFERIGALSAVMQSAAQYDDLAPKILACLCIMADDECRDGEALVKAWSDHHRDPVAELVEALRDLHDLTGQQTHKSKAALEKYGRGV